MAKAIKEEEGNLKARRERAEKQAESLKTYLSDEMQKIEKLKFEDEKHKISFRKSTSLKINELEFPQELMIEVTELKIPTKTELKERLQNGENIRGVKIVESKNIQIK